ncbi:hypothetical protein L596_029567 [Steinernema carpocapsae]|uniref:Alcohol dehydrogenase-like C-terminal domain-containing protein n=1 Tax=Steinernema carpocapsae TaxID=34508 RepID=A0A4V6XVM0_STECR|nr:hypothetical protein L596_029567 [Steinernema carpocapsae]
MGLISTALKHFSRSCEAAARGRWFSYAFFMPNSDCMNQLSTFLEEGQVKPIIDQVFPFSEVPKAYEKVGELHGRGKTIIDFEKSA